MKCPKIDSEYREEFEAAWKRLTEAQQRRAAKLIEIANERSRRLIVAEGARNVAFHALERAYISLAKHMGLPHTFFGAEE
jgi:hypothetical protein